jgi:hypothetical protein
LTTSSGWITRWVDELDRHQRSALVAALVAGVGVRLGYSFLTVSTRLSDDATHFWAIAGNIVDGRGYSYLGQPTAWRPPVYTYLVAGVREVGFGVRGVQGVQALATVATVGLLWLCARRLGLPAWAGVLAAWMGALYPPLIHFSSQIWSENASVPTLLLALYVSLLLLERPTLARAVAAGAAWGLAVLSRPSALAALGCLLIVLALGRAWRSGLRAAMTVAVAAATVVGPWVAWDAANVGGPLPVVSNESFTFWVSNRIDARGIKDVFRDPRYPGLQNYAVYGRSFPGIAALAAAHHFDFEHADEARRDRWFGTLVRHDIATDPWRFVFRAAEKTVASLNPAPDNASQVQRTSKSAKLVLWATAGPLLVAGWVGLGLMVFARPASRAWLFLGLASVVSLIGLAVHLPYVRYRVGAVDPMLILGAALLASNVVSRQRRRASSPQR